MRTTLYLIRHAATDANLASPARLQGRKHNPPLAKLGEHQAAATRDFLAVRTIDACYCSPLLRAVQTAAIIAEPHGIVPAAVDSLIECDIGDWEGMDWQHIRQVDPDNYHKFMSNPAENGYPNGENFSQVAQRATRTINGFLDDNSGRTLLVVSHHIINRTYLADLLGLGASKARTVALDNCGISVIVREGAKTTIATLNASFHLQGLAA
jgi:broad specificity phosphatase PhoE